MSDPLVTYRVALTAVLGVYLTAIVLTGYVVLSPALDVPFAIVGWLLFAGPCIWALVRHRKFATHGMLTALLRPLPLTLVFGGLLLFASYFAVAWRVPAQCNGTSLSCLKGYQWADTNGAFSHVPVGGVSAQISQATYIQEVGVHLRSAAAFGIYSLVFAWAASPALKRA